MGLTKVLRDILFLFGLFKTIFGKENCIFYTKINKKAWFWKKKWHVTTPNVTNVTKWGEGEGLK